MRTYCEGERRSLLPVDEWTGPDCTCPVADRHPGESVQEELREAPAAQEMRGEARHDGPFLQDPNYNAGR